jgi:hypothetical protein
MIELTVIIGGKELKFVFEEEPTESQIIEAIYTIGGRSRRD